MKAADVVLQKYPSPATAVKPEVFTAWYDVPPDTSAKDNWPTPVVPEPETDATFKNLSAVTFPVGNFNVYDWPAECGGDCNLIPCEFDSQFKITVPGFVLPPISTAPVPFGYKFKSLFETVIICWSFVS